MRLLAQVRRLRPPPGTLILIGALCALTTAFIRLSMWDEGQTWPRLWLTLTPETLPTLRLTSLLTNGLVAAPSSPLSLVILIAIAGYLFQHQLRALWAHQRTDLIFTVAITAFVLYVLDTYLLSPGFGWGLAAASLMLMWFASSVERRWGRTRTLLFSGWIMLGSNVFGALLLWIWPGSVMALFGGGGIAGFGTGPLIDGLLTAWALMIGRQRLQLIGVEGRHLIWFFVAMNVLDILFVGSLSGLMDLSGMGIAWLLIKGWWRPQLLIDRARLWLIDRRLERRRRKLTGTLHWSLL